MFKKKFEAFLSNFINVLYILFWILIQNHIYFLTLMPYLDTKHSSMLNPDLDLELNIQWRIQNGFAPNQPFASLLGLVEATIQ